MTIFRFLNNCQELKPEPKLTCPVAAPAPSKKRLLGSSGSATLVKRLCPDQEVLLDYNLDKGGPDQSQQLAYLGLSVINQSERTPKK